ncbi:MAG TPA: PilZ domain-containing protein [Thermoanaerobaculia bacterium]
MIDALVRSGALKTESRDGVEMVAGTQLERVLRDSLMRLYFAQATQAAGVTIAKEAAPKLEVSTDPLEIEEETPVITRTSDEHQLVPEAENTRPDLRRADRFTPRRQFGGMFNTTKIGVVQLSASGLRIRHDEGLRPGDEARLSFAILNPPQSIVVRARVVWTSIAQRGDSPSFYISGVRVIGNQDRLVNAMRLLQSAREVQLVENNGRRRGAMPKHVSGLPDEDVVAIIRAVRKFANDPAEATRWYTRARFAVADEEVRKLAPRGGREREEVLGVWEYLQRRIEIPAIAGVMQWIRSSQVAAV